MSQESGNTIVLLDLETTKRTLDLMVVDADVHLRLHADVIAASVQDGRVTDLEFAHPGGRTTVAARTFVDCSGDGVLLAAAGATTRITPPQRRQASTLVMRMGGVHDDADLGREAIRKAIVAYREATGARLDRDHGGVVRLPVSREVMVLLVDQHRDMLDVAESTAAEVESRQLAMHYARALRASVPGWEASYLAATGPEIGVRETRRLAGTDLVTADDVLAGPPTSSRGAAGPWRTTPNPAGRAMAGSGTAAGSTSPMAA